MNRAAELAEWDMPTLERLLDECARDDTTNYDALGYTPEEIASLVDAAADQATAAAAQAEAEVRDAQAAATSHDGAGTVAPSLSAGTDARPVATMSTVQLFFDAEARGEFLRMAERASKELGTVSVTDTVVAVLSAGGYGDSDSV